MIKPAAYVQSDVEKERHRRILVSIWACAYELHATSIVSDAEYDAECLQVNPDIPTGNPTMDKFFKTKFNPNTGVWIHQHPHLQRIKQLTEQIIAGKILTNS